MSATLTCFGSPSVINNSGIFNLGDWGSISGTPSSAINNTGKVQGTGSSGSAGPPSVEILTFRNNGGIVQVDSSTLTFIACTAVSSGSFNVTSTNASLPVSLGSMAVISF